MSGTQVITRSEQLEILADAVRQRRRLVLTTHAEDGWRLLKGKFAPSERGDVLIVEIDLSDTGGVRPGAIAGQSVGCTFRVGHKKCMFCSVVETVDDRPGVTFIRLKAPVQVQQLQRRAYERVAPPAGTVIAVRFWKETEGGSERNVRHGQMEDISAGGLRIRVADPTGIELEANYRCVFTPRPGKPTFVIDGLLRHKAAIDNGRASLGFQFIGLETTDEGQRALDRLARFVGQLHRTRQRRNPPRDRGQSKPDASKSDDV